jgi:NADH-quinone oxidoreductase subunit L
MTHAFFKALLFLGAGVVIMGLHGEHDMFKMGGLRRQLPLTFRAFLVGSASLSALPLVTAGFYSKDLILWQAWSSRLGSPWLWGAGLTGALLTSIYTFRMVFLTFFGQPKARVSRGPGICITIPLVVLAVLSVIGGFIELPETLGNRPVFSEFLHSVLPNPAGGGSLLPLLPFQALAAIVSLGGIWLAYLLFLRHRRYTENLVRTPLGTALHCFWLGGWSFDWLYDTLFVRPFMTVARLGKEDVVDLFYQGVARLSRILHSGLSATQTGRVRWYAAAIGIGAIVTIGIAVLL